MRLLGFIIASFFLLVILYVGTHLTKTHRVFTAEQAVYRTRIEKIVVDIKKINYQIKDEDAKKIAKAFIKYGKKYNVKINKLLKIASVESRFNYRAINHKTGDYGLMQINWRIWGSRYHRRPKELLNIEKNIKLACHILAYNRRIGFKKTAHYHSFDPEFVELYEARLSRFKFAKTY